MIEVLFSESEAGAMKIARGSTDKVICLGFMLDIGNIQEEVTCEYRKAFIYSMYAQEQWGSDPQTDKALKEIGDLYVEEWKRLIRFLDEGEEMRIWYHDSPYALCGFYHLCYTLLSDAGNMIKMVKLPEPIACSNEIDKLLKSEQILSEQERTRYAAIWQELQMQNSAVRANVNGKLISTTEDFYDFMIFQKLTKEGVTEARLIGEILGAYPIGIGDWWYAARIETLIKEEKILVAEESKRRYERILQASCQCLDGEKKKLQFSEVELIEAKRQIDSTLHKLRETVKTLNSKEHPERYKSQITLAKRRIEAFEIAVVLIENEH